jgi:hypothetical protein
MPIRVTCPGCHKRFSVSDQFAGKTGPCPHCKAKITVPTKSEEVVIHAPDSFGPKDASGRGVLKPLERETVRLSPAVLVGIAGGIAVTLITALVLRSVYRESAVPTWLLGAGAVLLAPPAVLAGYFFLRNDELEPYRGVALAVRVVICGLAYAALWAAYGAVKSVLLGGAAPETYQLVFLGPVLLAIGAFAALASLDLDFGNGILHYVFYLLVTVTACWIVGAPVL